MTQLQDDFISFLHKSPTPYHAANQLASIFQSAGFVALDETQDWQLEKGGKYYFLRSDSTIVAFTLGQQSLAEGGMRICGAHTDSPCLKVKAQPELTKQEYNLLGVEVYGGALLNPWFDRDLSLAGKVFYLDKGGKLASALIDFKEPIAVVPSLAIHLDREANAKRTVNPQTHMNVLLQSSEDGFSLRDILLNKLKEDGRAEVEEVLDYDLRFYDCQMPHRVGLKQEFIAGARLDNLLSCYLSAKALTEVDDEVTSIVVCHDHEEVGSESETGAGGSVMESLLERLIPENEQRHRASRQSLFLSLDNAHGIHPNYPDKHDENHGPILNKGPVIKFDAKQRYATSPETSSVLKKLAKQNPELPLQSFVTRSDMRCGSTIGPMSSAKLGIKALDVGMPTFAMHSTRELSGTEDLSTMYALLNRFFTSKNLWL
ncbi:MAG: M18 family aminopeptidase [Agarilytica sp.]